MKYIPPNFTKQFGKLTKIEIANSGLKDINHLYGLKEIVITNNNIRIIEVNSFKGSPNVEVIIITGNNIQKITDEAFKENKEVMTFDISNNNITNFSTECIETLLLSGSTINISQNNMQNIVWVHTGNVTGQIIAEDNPCIDMKSGKKSEDFVTAVQDGCSEKNELECEFKYIDEGKILLASKPINLLQPFLILSKFSLLSF